MKTGKIRTGAIISLIMVVMIALFLIFGVLNHKQMIYYSGRLFISTNEDVSEKVALEAEQSEFDSPYIGVIASSVNKSGTPDQELQSNFGGIGSEVIFNGNGIAVDMDGKWIQFDPQDDSLLQPDQLTQLYESITYSDGNVAFTIPDGNDVWNIQINGRIHVDGVGEMSIHYLEEESEHNSWGGGKTYSFDVSGAKYSRFTELYLDAQLNNEEMSIDILEFLPEYLKMTGDLEEADR